MSEVMFCTEQGAMFVPNETEIPDLKSKDTFKKATVVRGTYFFYKNQDYNSAGIDKNLQIKEGETKDISEFNGSFYALPYQQQGIVLFALPYFNGYHKWYENNCPDITGAGVSSIILLSTDETWQLYQGTQYRAPFLQLSGETKLEYEDLGELDNTVRSVRKA